MNHKNLYSVLVTVVVLLIITLACGSSNEGKVITPDSPEKEQQEIDQAEPTQEIETPEEETEAQKPTEKVQDKAETEPSFEVFAVGDLIEVKDHTIRLNSIEYQGSVLVANFTVENHGDSDITVSSLLSFSAKNEDGTRLEQEIFDCGTSGLDGTVLPGDILRGDICWSDASPDAHIKIYYESYVFDEGAVVWNAVEGTAEELEADTDSTSKVVIFELGEIIEVQDHTIRLNSLEYDGNSLVANFTVENHNDEDVNISSMLLFTAKRSDGTKLEQEVFECESPGFDGKILPGDRLRGNICWSDASPEDEIKIYYEASVFGEGAIVWEAIEGLAEPIEYTDAKLKVDVYQVGDIIEVNGQVIVLNEYEFIGDVLKANFTIENQGSEDINVSSLISFYARIRDGATLEQEYFDCGSSLDGTVIVGDKLTGDICWKNANPEDGIKLYYEAEVFGEGAVVWFVETKSQ